MPTEVENRRPQPCRECGEFTWHREWVHEFDWEEYSAWASYIARASPICFECEGRTVNRMIMLRHGLDLAQARRYPARRDDLRVFYRIVTAAVLEPHIRWTVESQRSPQKVWSIVSGSTWHIGGRENITLRLNGFGDDDLVFDSTTDLVLPNGIALLGVRFRSSQSSIPYGGGSYGGGVEVDAWYDVDDMVDMALFGFDRPGE